MQNKKAQTKSGSISVPEPKTHSGSSTGSRGDEAAFASKNTVCFGEECGTEPKGFGDGHDKSFEELAKGYEHVIRAVASTFSVPSSELEDLYQEGLIALYRAVCNYDESIAKFSTFANVCIRRAMMTWIRDHVAKTDSDGNTVTEIPLDEAFSAELPEDSSTPEELYISKEQLATLRKNAMKRLSGYEKCVFLMYLDNMTVAEICDALEKSRKSVENALGRIRKKISGISECAEDGGVYSKDAGSQ